MNIATPARFALCISATAAILAGCSAARTSTPVIPVSQTQSSNASSWPPSTASGTTLLYASDDTNGTVDAYDYPSGKLVGRATGFTGPAGLCSDKQGNVYVADSTTGIGSEIAAGTTRVMRTWQVGGDVVGCSVSATGDVAFTDFSRYGGGSSGLGGVTVFPAGGSAGIRHKGPAYDAPAGYDSNGNLWVQCSDSAPCASPAVFVLPKGGNSWKRATLKGAVVHKPASIELMGKALGLGDNEVGGKQTFGIYSARISGTTLQVSKTTVNTAACGVGGQTNVDQWANVSGSPNGLQAGTYITATIGPNDACNGTPIQTWPFPFGGAPSSSFTPSGNSYGVTLVKL